MPDLNVCTGPAFTTGGSGELVVAGSGSKSWPFGAPIAANNGLNTDPVNGLWTAPHGCYAVVSEQSASSLSQALSTTAWPIPSTGFTFANPSATAKMRITALVHARMTVNLAAASAAFITNSIQFAGAAGVRNASNHIANPIAGAVSGMPVSAWNVTETFVDAGATATLNASCTATLLTGSGAVTLTAWVVWVQFVVWLLDTTQAGGIT